MGIVLHGEGVVLVEDASLIEYIDASVKGEPGVVAALKTAGDGFITLTLPHPPSSGEWLVRRYQAAGWPYVCIRCVRQDASYEFELGALGLTPAQSVLSYLLHEEMAIRRLAQHVYVAHSVETNVELSEVEWDEVDRGLQSVGWKKGRRGVRELATSGGGNIWKYRMTR